MSAFPHSGQHLDASLFLANHHLDLVDIYLPNLVHTSQNRFAGLYYHHP